MSHTCHATACNAHCKPEHLMCAAHWALVTPATKRAVLTHYRPGQCNDMRPSKEWLDAANLAVGEVAQICGMPMSRRHKALLAAHHERDGHGRMGRES